MHGKINLRRLFQGFVFVLIITLSLQQPYTVKSQGDSVSDPSIFPSCTQLLSSPGDLAHFTDGMHQIAGDGLLAGADDVYALTDGNAVQCFCPAEGMGIQTNWWKTNATNDGWIQVANGLQWNLSDHAYLAKNSDFDCHPPGFPACTELLSSPGDIAHYTEGSHQIAGDGLKNGADDVYALTNGNAVQCFCPAEGTTGIQTNWWKTDTAASGWIEIANGADWNLESGHYLAKNSDFNCNPNFPPCVQLLSTPGDLAHYTDGMHQIAGDGLLAGRDDVYSLSDGNAVQCFCPVEGTTGIQTNWWKTDTAASGWISIANGLSWNLDDHAYLAKNSEFDCNPPDGGGGGGVDTGASITVTKVVVNDNDGDAEVSDFVLKVGETVVTSGVASTNFPPATYVVTESGGPAGYAATFSGDCDSEGKITVAANQNYTCTITNNDNPPVGGGEEGGGGGGGGSSGSSSGGGGGGAALPTGGISGAKFNDQNGNGVWDAGELGLANWTIYVDLNNNSVWDNSEPMQATAGDGSYSFAGLGVGNYYVRELAQSGWNQTFPTSLFGFTHYVAVSNTNFSGINFGNKQGGQVLGEDMEGPDVGGAEALPRTGQTLSSQLALLFLIGFVVIRLRRPVTV